MLEPLALSPMLDAITCSSASIASVGLPPSDSKILEDLDPDERREEEREEEREFEWHLDDCNTDREREELYKRRELHARLKQKALMWVGRKILNKSQPWS